MNPQKEENTSREKERGGTNRAGHTHTMSNENSTRILRGGLCVVVVVDAQIVMSVRSGS